MTSEFEPQEKRQAGGSERSTDADLLGCVEAASLDVISIRDRLADALNRAETSHDASNDAQGGDRPAIDGLHHALSLLESAAAALRLVPPLMDRTREREQAKPWCGKCHDSQFRYHLDFGYTGMEGDFADPCPECHPDPSVGTRTLLVRKGADGQTRISLYRGRAVASSGVVRLVGL